MRPTRLLAVLLLGLGCTGVVTGTLARPVGDAGSKSADDAGLPNDAGTDAGTPPPDSGTPPPDGGIVPPLGRDYSTDSSKFFGDSRCAKAGLELCDGFESGAVDMSLWTVQGTAPTLDSIHVARGAKALHIKGGINQASFLHETKTFPATDNAYYGRMFVYFSAFPSAPGMPYAHWTLVAATGTGVTGQIRVGGQMQSRFAKGPLNYFGVGTDSQGSSTGTGDWTNSDNDPSGAATPLPLNQWMCLEWMHDGAHDTTSFWWDAVHHASLDTSASKHGGNANPYVLPKFDKLAIGWQEYQADNGESLELWIDEVAVDSTRIGCVL